MCATWLTLPAFPDARAALDKLAAARIRRLVLSNGTPSMIRAALDASQLPIDEIRSADEVRAYKTDPRVYALVPLEGPCSSAATAGMRKGRSGRSQSGLVDRGGPAPGLAPDLRAGSLSELADELT